MKLGVAYFGAAAFAVGLTRFQGGVACFWVAAAVLLARLVSQPRHAWRRSVGICWLGSLLATGFFGVGWSGALMLATLNVGESVIAALLIERWQVSRSALNSLPQLLRFVVAAGIVGPGATAAPGAAIVAWVTHTPFVGNMANWMMAHALGALTFTPIFALVATGDLGRWWRNASAREAAEAAGVLALVAVTVIGVFIQVRYPILFLPAFPLIFATFRMGRAGAALGLVLVAAIGGVLTLQGLGPISLMRGSLVAHVQFFQFYLAVTLLTVLPVAADLTRRRHVYAALRDSEARLRIIMEHSGDVVVSQRLDGSLSYISPSADRRIAHSPEELDRRGLAALLAPDDLARSEQARLEALAAPDRSFAVEFTPPSPANENRWFEITLRAVVDADGTRSGTVGTIREITERKLREAALTHAAETDPLTGLANRRVFDGQLARAVGGGGEGGCLVLLDLDHFKQINDRFGHGIGDEVLRIFASRVRRGLKAGDLLARIGGEEFGVLLPGAGLEQGRAVCERLRALIADEPLETSGQTVRLTVSAGVADLRRATDRDEVMRLADLALYRAKANGRNRAEVAA